MAKKDKQIKKATAVDSKRQAHKEHTKNKDETISLKLRSSTKKPEDRKPVTNRYDGRVRGMRRTDGRRKSMRKLAGRPQRKETTSKKNKVVTPKPNAYDDGLAMDTRSPIQLPSDERNVVSVEQESITEAERGCSRESPQVDRKKFTFKTIKVVTPNRENAKVNYTHPQKHASHCANPKRELTAVAGTKRYNTPLQSAVPEKKSFEPHFANVPAVKQNNAKTFGGHNKFQNVVNGDKLFESQNRMHMQSRAKHFITQDQKSIPVTERGKLNDSIHSGFNQNIAKTFGGNSKMQSFVTDDSLFKNQNPLHMQSHAKQFIRQEQKSLPITERGKLNNSIRSGFNQNNATTFGGNSKMQSFVTDDSLFKNQNRMHMQSHAKQFITQEQKSIPVTERGKLNDSTRSGFNQNNATTFGGHKKFQNVVNGDKLFESQNRMHMQSRAKHFITQDQKSIPVTERGKLNDSIHSGFNQNNATAFGGNSKLQSFVTDDSLFKNQNRVHMQSDAKQFIGQEQKSLLVTERGKINDSTRSGFNQLKVETNAGPSKMQMHDEQAEDYNPFWMYMDGPSEWTPMPVYEAKEFNLCGPEKPVDYTKLYWNGSEYIDLEEEAFCTGSFVPVPPPEIEEPKEKPNEEDSQMQCYENEPLDWEDALIELEKTCKGKSDEDDTQTHQFSSQP